MWKKDEKIFVDVLLLLLSNDWKNIKTDGKWWIRWHYWLCGCGVDGRGEINICWEMLKYRFRTNQSILKVILSHKHCQMKSLSFSCHYLSVFILIKFLLFFPFNVSVHSSTQLISGLMWFLLQAIYQDINNIIPNN